jgi:hypothetical protein
VPLAVPRDRQGIDREHLIAGGQQRLYPRAAVGLDPDDNLRRVVELAVILTDMLPDQLVQQRDPGMPSGSRPRTSLRPVSSWISMSRWASAQSSPTNSTNSSSCPRPDSSVEPEEGLRRADGPVLGPGARRHTIHQSSCLSGSQWAPASAVGGHVIMPNMACDLRDRLIGA